MNPRYRSRVGAPPQLAADAAASAIYCAMPFLVVHYLGDWRLTPPWLVLPAGMLAVTLYCLIRELSTVMIADGNICLRCLGFKVTEFPLEELRTAKLIFKGGAGGWRNSYSKTASAVGSISLCTRKTISGGRSEPPIAVEGKAFSSQQQRSGWSS